MKTPKNSKTTQRRLAQEVARNCACFKVRQAARRITKSYDEALKPIGLKVTQFTVLAAVTIEEGSLSLTELADKLGMERSTLSRNLRPLERRSLIKLSPEGYRRTRTVEITEEGAQVFQDAIPLWRGAQEQFRQALGLDEWSAFHKQMQLIGKTA